jgi:O-antigen ligase
MVIQFHAKWAAIAFTALVLACCLFEDRLLLASNSFVGAFIIEAHAYFSDARVQPIVYVCIAAFLVILVLLPFRQSDRTFLNIDRRAFWMVGIVGFSTYAYFSYLPFSRQSDDVLTILFGAALGQNLLLFCHSNLFKRRHWGYFLITTLLLFLALGSLRWSMADLPQRYYRGELRWVGAWGDPNTYGMLMGMGFVFAFGLLVQILIIKNLAQRLRGQNVKARCLKDLITTFLCGFALLLITRGLLHSYSRGAWLGTLVALMYLCGAWLRILRRESPQSGTLSVFNIRPISLLCGRGSLSWVVILTAAAVLAFWQFHQTELRPMRRLFSIANRNDFSWRNRVVAWKGALQMMAEEPLHGFGWSRPESLYAGYYLESKFTEAAAIQTNGYLLLGATFGIPSLVCFGMYGWLSLTCKSEHKNCNLYHLSHGANIDKTNDEFAELQNLQVISRAGVIVLLIGFWFDVGLFVAATATSFWILLELAYSMSREANEFNQVAGPSVNVKSDGSCNLPSILSGLKGFLRLFGKILQPMTEFVPGLAVLFFVGALLWARNCDPFARQWFAIKTPENGRIECVAVVPKVREVDGLVIYAHDRGGSLMNDGNDLLRLAGLGLTAVSLEYDQTNVMEFEAQFETLVRGLASKKWAGADAAAWVGIGLGADRMSDFAFRHPELQPQLLIQVYGTGAQPFVPSGQFATNIHCRVLFVHCQRNGLSPVASAKLSNSTPHSNGVTAGLRTLSGVSHSMEPGHGAIIRSAGEYCLKYLAKKEAWWDFFSPHWQAQSVPLWVFCLPGTVWALGWLIWWQRRRTKPAKPVTLKRHGIAACGLAATLAVLALAETVVHLATPHLLISNSTLTIAREFLMPPKQRKDFEFLATQPVWHRQKLKALLDHVELAEYNRELINWRLDDKIYRDYVLSPVIESSTLNSQFSTSLNWRQPLWEEFYPLIGHEASPEDAAYVVVRHLRERVTVVDAPGLPQEIPEIWHWQVADRAGFESIYVAALRSVGVPARLNTRRQAEFWSGDKWADAPRPSVDSW